MLSVMKTIPSAWLGFSAEFAAQGERVARICMKCEDRPTAEKIAERLGVEVTHGLCACCASAMLAELAPGPLFPDCNRNSFDL